MHAFKLVSDVLQEVLARSEEKKVLVVRLKVGETCHAAPADVEFLFVQAARGTRAEGARLEITARPGEELTLESIRVE